MSNEFCLFVYFTNQSNLLQMHPFLTGITAGGGLLGEGLATGSTGPARKAVEPAADCKEVQPRLCFLTVHWASLWIASGQKGFSLRKPADPFPSVLSARDSKLLENTGQ